ncbi:SPB10 protein, partial [Mohoua ochrocephala]|nr:SPB10 protein [Mohoua ochrocephala]
NETRPVQMMFKEDTFNMTYIGDLQTKILELPYVGKELSMIILLPDAIQDGSTGLERVKSQIHCTETCSSVPERLRPWCQHTCPSPPCPQSDCPPMSVLLRLCAAPLARGSGRRAGTAQEQRSAVVVSFVEVNEEGTEAAAATAAVMMMRCAMVVPEFTADHPFLFFIRHNKTSSILFCGRFCCP